MTDRAREAFLEMQQHTEKCVFDEFYGVELEEDIKELE